MSTNEPLATEPAPVLDPRQTGLALGRRFQIWDYSPSHRRLLLRSPASGGDDENVDITFSGVRRIDLDTGFRIDAITSEPAGDGLPGLRQFSLGGQPRGGLVVAEYMRVESNVKSLFEALGGPGAKWFEAEKELELELTHGIKTGLPAATVSRQKDSGSDIVVTLGNRRVFIELVRSSEASPERQVRRRVMERIERLGPFSTSSDALFLVVEGPRKQEVAELSESHLRTALGTSAVRAMAWEEGRLDTLVQGLSRLLSS